MVVCLYVCLCDGLIVWLYVRVFCVRVSVVVCLCVCVCVFGWLCVLVVCLVGWLVVRVCAFG